jgi:hypothetical protein
MEMALWIQEAWFRMDVYGDLGEGGRRTKREKKES